LFRPHTKMRDGQLATEESARRRSGLFVGEAGTL
jgi:hypothetical protein